MKAYLLKDIAKITSSELVGNSDSEVSQIFFDSRSIISPRNGIFFAIQGKQKDGQQFAEDAYKKGIRNFVIKEKVNLHKDANYLISENPLKALQDWAKHHREQFHFPIIGITGSNGKTIVKEWLNQLLWKKFNIVRSPKSYNSQLGVPISVLQINENNDLGIFEAGISQPSEMQNLAEIIKPTIGVFTNLGNAHLENFISTEELAQEKSLLFSDSEKIIYNKDEVLLSEIFSSEKYSNKQFVSFGESEKSEVQLLSKEILNNYYQIKIRISRENYTYKIPFTDEASCQNSLIVIAVIHALGLNVAEFLEEMNFLLPIEMRLQLKEGIKNSIIINDAFNSDLKSVKIALDVLNQQSKPKKSIVLTDILQSNLPEKELYKQLSEMVNEYEIDEVVLIGKEISEHKNLFNSNVRAFDSTEEFHKTLSVKNVSDEAILLKGARPFRLEMISEFLEKKSHDTVLEVNLTALIENVNSFREKLNPETKIMCMLKANGYGAGSFEIAQALEYHKVDYLGVAYADEGVELRRAGIALPIMVMNPEQSSYSKIIDYQLEPEIYSLRVLDLFIQTLKEKSISAKYPIHLKINTGMNRLGFKEEEFSELIKKLKKEKSVEVKSIFTHLATADVEDEKDFTLEQLNRFAKNYDYLSKELNIRPIKHALNSAGILNFPEYQSDMVRLGIGMYGLMESEKSRKLLKNVITFKTVISKITEINKGETVSYGRKFKAIEKMKIATLPVGYADGIRRSLGWQNSEVNIRGSLCSIIGTICMDMMMVDVTNINCQEGDEVIIFGEKPSIMEIAEKLETIPYEVITSISSRVKRVYYRES